MEGWISKSIRASVASELRIVMKRGAMREDAGALLGGSCALMDSGGLRVGSADLPNARKMRWVAPAIAVVALNRAQGAEAGDKCDRYGSLSHGSNCEDH